MLNLYLARPEISSSSCSILQGISDDHCEVLLEVEWGEKCRETQAERLVPVYHKTNVSGLPSFMRDKFLSWASNGSCVEDIWKSFKEIVLDSIDRFVPHTILRKKILILNIITRK
jgi:hypothetical protein